jgi:hypothetical protein
VAAGNHTHSAYSSSSHSHNVTVTLAVTKQVINYVDQYNNSYSLEVVTDVAVQGVSCGQPQ